MEAQQCVELTGTNRPCGLTTARWRGFALGPETYWVVEDQPGSLHSSIFLPTAIGAGATPVPIPNTEVKPRIGDGTVRFLDGRVARRWDLLRRRRTSWSGAASVLRRRNPRTRFNVTTPHRIFGIELSPYSVKVRSYFRYKRIPHEWVVRDAARMAEFQKYAKLPLIPLVVTPEDEGLQPARRSAVAGSTPPRVSRDS